MKIGVLTSGGDAPGMNAAIRAVARAGIYNNVEVVGISRGYAGLINSEFHTMSVSSVADIIQRGGTILRTARCEEFKTEFGRKKGIHALKAYGIDGLVVIGGDGSFTGAQLLSQEGINTIGIPGTIDNDLAYTDYSIGFDTALNTVLDAVTKIRDTSTSHEKATIIEVMGRNCGDIALYAGLACGAESILVPEEPFDIDQVCEKIIQGKQRGKLHNIIMLAEGAGHAFELQKQILDITGIDARITVLGFIQRGGDPTAFDRILASRMGGKAVEVLLNGKTSRAIGIRNNDIIDVAIEEALAHEKNRKSELYNLSQILSI